MSGRPGPNVIRICKRCGEGYHPVSPRQQCCNKPIKVPCVICGKLMDQICTLSKQSSTCSKECSTELGNRGRLEAAHKLMRKCKYCGKEFVPEASRDFYCKDKHYATCEVCGKQFEIIGRIDVANKTCSKECRYISAKKNTDMVAMQEHLKATMLEKYGVDNPGQIEGIHEKVKAKMREKYGVDYYTQTEEYKERVKQTCREKYGVDHHLAAAEVKAKREETVKKKYGVKNVFASDYGKKKVKETLLNRYGVINPGQSAEFHSKMSKNRSRNVAKDGKVFDSRGERQFYDFMLDIKVSDIDTQVPVGYIYKNKTHKTLIDFKVNDRLYEVKGIHLLSGVFGNKGIPIEVKLQVYNDNNVIVITNNQETAKEIINRYENIIGMDVSLFDNRMTTENKLKLWAKIQQAIKLKIKFIDATTLAEIQ